MRFSLIDLLLATATIGVGTLIAVPIARLLGIDPSYWPVMLIGCLVGVSLYFLAVPLIYWKFGLLPLMLPTCPSCSTRPDRYLYVEVRWPKILVKCTGCDHLLELWWRRPSPGAISDNIPSVLLIWPHSVGRWRVISRDVA